MKITEQKINQAVLALRRLCLYKDITTDPVFATATRLLDLLYEDAPLEVLETYHDLVGQLAASELGPKTNLDPWQNRLVELILYADNPFTRKAELYSLGEMSTSLVKAAQNDLASLQTIFSLSWLLPEAVRYYLKQYPPTFLAADLPTWDTFQGMEETGDPITEQLKALFRENQDWPNLLPQLVEYYQRCGTGQFGRFHGFRWSEEGLRGIPQPDPIRLENLIGYERERELIIKNTEMFLKGARANNILLYGDRGTGKSSTVKALLNEYGPRGLRLIEVPKQMLGQYSQIISLIEDRPQRFVLFVDDLSFDENEGQYRDLKAILEGGLEVKPDNVVIYATSNRRHLVKETFQDRNGELRSQDTVQEKLSLADRFGITITFLSPDQKTYLAIVDGLAQQRGLPIDRETLHRRAIEWQAWHNGRSGRTARQFIDHLAAELA
ncbi:MAG: ATP-binding protein [Limnochordia bacterium]|jgi:predicted AAA+ superfamily ATPase